ncbi:MAG: hypothetical protein M3Z06_05435 [Actinomycetota bacterium]|nr:hypothetical protein [Actinomycetota bacterium]
MTTEDDRPVPDVGELGATEPTGPASGAGATPDSLDEPGTPDAPTRRVIRRGGSAPAPDSLPDAPAPDTARTSPAGAPKAMIPAREGRPRVEAVLMRVIATAGIIGISVAIAAVMGSQHSQAWLIGLVTSIVSVVLAAVLWSSRRL